MAKSRRIVQRKVSKRKSRKTKKSKKSKCQKMVSKKIAINMREFKEGKMFVSPKQAIAVAYSQVKKKSPLCAKLLRK